jgi:hypothetical protein
MHRYVLASHGAVFHMAERIVTCLAYPVTSSTRCSISDFAAAILQWRGRVGPSRSPACWNIAGSAPDGGVMVRRQRGDGMPLPIGVYLRGIDLPGQRQYDHGNLSGKETCSAPEGSYWSITNL